MNWTLKDVQTGLWLKATGEQTDNPAEAQRFHTRKAATLTAKRLVNAPGLKGSHLKLTPEEVL